MFIRYVALRLVSLDFERKLVIEFKSRGRGIFFKRSLLLRLRALAREMGLAHCSSKDVVITSCRKLVSKPRYRLEPRSVLNEISSRLFL